MKTARDVLILGGGILGCLTAHYLSELGVAATVIERSGIAGEASGKNSGTLGPLLGPGMDGPLGDMTMASFPLHASLSDTLRERSGVEFGYKNLSRIQLAFEESELERLQQTYDRYRNADGFSAAWLNPDELFDLEPGINRSAIRAVRTEGDAAVDSDRYVAAIARAAESGGAEIRNAEAIGIRTSDRRVTEVVCRDARLRCGQLVIAAGPWSAEVARWLGLELPLEPVKGEMLWLDLPAPGHDISWGGASLYHRRLSGFGLGCTVAKRGFDRQPTVEAREFLLQRALRMLPAVEGARVRSQTAALRDLTPDGIPLLGPAPGWDNVYLAAGGGSKGLVLSPLMARAVADLIATGRTSLPVAPADPARFSLFPGDGPTLQA